MAHGWEESVAQRVGRGAAARCAQLTRRRPEVLLGDASESEIEIGSASVTPCSTVQPSGGEAAAHSTLKVQPSRRLDLRRLGHRGD